MNGLTLTQVTGAVKGVAAERRVEGIFDSTAREPRAGPADEILELVIGTPINGVPGFGQ
jgi:hypothetical protein